MLFFKYVKRSLCISIISLFVTFSNIRARICKSFQELGMDSQPGGPVRQPYLTYRPARLHRPEESIPGLLKRLQRIGLLSIGLTQRVLAINIKEKYTMRNEDADLSTCL